MKFPRRIRLDASDLNIYVQAANSICGMTTVGHKRLFLIPPV